MQLGFSREWIECPNTWISLKLATHGKFPKISKRKGGSLLTPPLSAPNKLGGSPNQRVFVTPQNQVMSQLYLPSAHLTRQVLEDAPQPWQRHLLGVAQEAGVGLRVVQHVQHSLVQHDVLLQCQHVGVALGLQGRHDEPEQEPCLWHPIWRGCRSSRLSPLLARTSFCRFSVRPNHAQKVGKIGEMKESTRL